LNASIDIVEPSKEAQSLAKSRLGEIPYDRKKLDFSWHSSLGELKNKSDVAIIATTAAGRVDTIESLIKSGHSRFVVEKMVCQSAKEYDHLLDVMDKTKSKGWVNTTRHYFEFYQKLKSRFKDGEPLHMSVVSGNQGLGSNAIHFIDLFCWLAGSYDINLDGRFLADKIYPNKRGKELTEFAGTIVGTTGHSFLDITFLPNEDSTFTVAIAGKDVNLVIDESNERVLVLRGQVSETVYKNKYVSNTTTKILADIFKSDDCVLPTLKDSSYAHRELFRIFNDHIKKLTNEERVLCPIT
jgi:predicted dehydrogenase